MCEKERRNMETVRKNGGGQTMQKKTDGKQHRGKKN